MLIQSLGAVLAALMLELMALTLPAQADPAENCSTYSDRLSLQRAIGGLQSQDNNFFDVGQERFEQDIERLLQGQPASDASLLTIDASIPVEPVKPEPVEQPAGLVEPLPQ